MRRRFALSIATTIAVLSLGGHASADAIDEARLHQYIAPLECTQETIHNGVTAETYVIPNECEQEIPGNPGHATNPSVGAPDTGLGRIIIDGVSAEDGIVIGLTVLFVLLAIALRRRYQRDDT